MSDGERTVQMIPRSDGEEVRPTASLSRRTGMTPVLIPGPEAPAEVVPQLVPQPHGGAIRAGGNVGNKGGVGRVPSELRARLRGTFEERIAVLEEIADGHPVQRVKLGLAKLLPHVACPNCGDHLEPRDRAKLPFVSLGRFSGTCSTIDWLRTRFRGQVVGHHKKLG